jgi:hypothetical protein
MGSTEMIDQRDFLEGNVGIFTNTMSNTNRKENERG